MNGRPYKGGIIKKAPSFSPRVRSPVFANCGGKTSWLVSASCENTEGVSPGSRCTCLAPSLSLLRSCLVFSRFFSREPSKTLDFSCSVIRDLEQFRRGNFRGKKGLVLRFLARLRNNFWVLKCSIFSPRTEKWIKLYEMI